MATLKDLSNDIAALVETASKSVVQVDARRGRAGTGIVWDNGLVLTANHVVEQEQDIEVVFGDTRAKATLIGRDPATDVALLKVDGLSAPALPRAKVEDLVSEAKERGAEAVVGGRRPKLDLPGWFYEPTVLTGGDPAARIEREEVFGPVVTVRAFDGEDEVVQLANESSFGLGASVWTRDADRARRVASRIEAGMVWTNDLGYSYGAGPAPWGGVKESGFGRTHGKHGLYECSQIKLVDSDAGRFPVPWWYPYGPRALDGFKGVVEVLHGDAKLRALWTHRRGLAHLARRYVKR